MRAAMVALVGITATLVAAPAATAAPAAVRSPDPRLTITAVQLGRTSIAVSGLNRVAVPITVKAGYDSDDPMNETMELGVVLRRTGGSGPISWMAATESCVADCMPAICVPISSVALAVCAASALTSCATTAKPRPASPARAASMVAFRASRLAVPQWC